MPRHHVLPLAVLGGVAFGWILAHPVLADGEHALGTPAYPPEVGEPHPDFSAFDQDGLPFVLSEQSGRAVLLHICAIWCVPCRDSAMVEADLVAELDALIGPEAWTLVDGLMENNVGLPAAQSDAQLWRQELGTPARTVHPDGNSGNDFYMLASQVPAIPLYVVIDPQGIVTGLVEGFDSSSTPDLLVTLVRDSVGPPVFIDGFEG